MTRVPVRGIDSIVGECVSSNITLTFDYGWYNGSGTFKQNSNNWGRFRGLYLNLKITETTIDGHAAEIVSYQMPQRPTGESDGKTNVMRIKFPKVGSDPKNSLSMTTYCRSEADYPISRQIFESIRFKSHRTSKDAEDGEMLARRNHLNLDEERYEKLFLKDGPREIYETVNRILRHP